MQVELTKASNRFIKIASVVGAITIIAGGYTWYLNNIWKPKISVKFVDFVNGVATLDHSGKEIDLEGDAVYWINADWGVRFGTIYKEGKNNYDRIELLKKGMVVEYLSK